jgi:hypothetical protein
MLPQVVGLARPHVGLVEASLKLDDGEKKKLF